MSIASLEKLRALLSQAVTALGRWLGVLPASQVDREPMPTTPTRTASVPLRPLERIVLTDGVCRTLFEEFEEHRQGERGDEETGWILMGYRQGEEAIATATLPAGAERQAGVAHVRFNSEAQALASRILRQSDKNLGILGVVHTHPGSLRHPSRGDFEGDRIWVRYLRGREGVFGIGTADGDEDTPYAINPKEHSQCYLGLRFTWYALAEGDSAYRPLPVVVTLGEDLARPLHRVWDGIEAHAARLDRLCCQLARVGFEVVDDEAGSHLHCVIPVDKKTSIRVVADAKRPVYCLERNGEWLVSEESDPRIDRGVFLMLAELS
ncbi:MAG: Mov34/MPN/PAD-1 family protein [Gemmatales bacterium]|nr:Mov34/MPN/PAD-1 family protein [Gemmatales bacterium]MDW8387018.1 Mov34/MPN/PAD-1 family protein [Gemmatales bacterium]